MSNPHLIALAGFDSFEYTTFESFFRLAGRREPGYLVCGVPALARLLIINSDNLEALLSTLHARLPEQLVLLVGHCAHPAAAGLPTQLRPIRFMPMLAAVDKLLTAAQDAAIAEVAPPTAPAVPVFQAPVRPAPPTFETTQPYVPLTASIATRSRAFAATEPFAPLSATPTAESLSARPTAAVQATPSAAAPDAKPRFVTRPETLISAEMLAAYKRAANPVAAAPAPAPAAPAASNFAATQAASLPAVSAPSKSSGFKASTNFLGLGGGAAPVVPNNPIDDVLVVADNDTAVKFMQNRLGRMGFRVTIARTGENALNLLPQTHFCFVFLDLTTGSMDGFQTCRAIKKRLPGKDQAPKIFMLSNRGGVFDKMRANLAGADAYLIKPLNEFDLKKLLAKYEQQSSSAYAATRLASQASVPSTVLSSRPH